MDNSPEGVASAIAGETLSYDDTVAYEEQIPTYTSNGSEQTSLADRIGRTKLYLLSETSVSRGGKRKHVEAEQEEEEENEMELGSTYRGNAILLQGSPIAHLPTARLFAYAKHFDVQPMGLEWVDDNTCVLVFPSKSLARMAHQSLQKSAIENEDMDGFVTVKPLPVAMWPAEERINDSLGKGEGLRGTIRMRWALDSDVKKKGARQSSAFYRKHGRMAGKEAYGGEGLPPAAKRRRDDDGLAPELQRAQLDEELDQFLAEENDEPSEPASPPSKMRSDYIASDGRTLLQRTSAIRVHSDFEFEPTSLADRLMAPLPQRARNGWRGRMRSSEEPESTSESIWSEKAEWGSERPRSGDGDRMGRRGDRRPRYQPRRLTQQELDDEMDAFLNERED